MKKLLYIIICNITFSSLVLSQSASVTWPLSNTTTTSPTNSGNVVGQNEAFGNMVINNYTGPNSSQRVTTTDGAWPAESAQNESRYIQFAVSPGSGYSFNINSITLSLGASGGSNMRANIWYSTEPSFSTRTQLNSSVLVLPNGSLSSLSYTPSVLVNDGQTFYLRIYPWYTTASTGKYVCPQNVVISGTTSTALPQITTSVSSLSNFTQVVGEPSSTQSYTVSGSNLTNDVIITSPPNFEISSDNGTTWNNNSSPITLTQSGGSIIGQPVTILVRLNASSAANYSGNISHTSTGAVAKNVLVSGVTLATEPTVQSSISFGTVTSNSIVVNFSGGNGAKRILVARAVDAVTWAPTDGNAVSGVNSNFSSATDQGNGNKVVYDGTGNSVTVSGLTQTTTYHFAVYEYNVGSGNSQNYLTNSPGRGNQTTITGPTISVVPSSLSFGSVEINTTSEEKTYALSATALSPENGNITVSAPTGYEVSITTGSGFGSSLLIPYTGGTLNAITIYVRFKPTLAQGYVGNITNAGGGAVTQNVSVSGNGIGPAEPNVFQAEDAILINSYVFSQYSGYTGSGYVDMADRTGSAVEFTFRRETPATDTVIVRFANGGSSRALAVSLNGASQGTLNFVSTGSWSNWSNATTTIPLQAGINRLRFTLTTNGSGPNIDKITINGQTATAVYKLHLTKSGYGSVVASPTSADSFFNAGTAVTLTAYPNAGNKLHRWSGTEQSRNNPFTFTMNSHKTIIGIMADEAGISALPYQASPKGFASVAALGCANGTTGGSGQNAHTVYVTSVNELNSIMYGRVDANRTLNLPPLTINVIGTLTGSGMIDVKDVYDISIIGVGVDATLSGCGLNIYRSSNIIVRNLKFQNSPDDGISVDAGDDVSKGHHIWIDHCTFTNCYDGALDVTHGAAYVTVSWNYFFNQDKTSLVGHSDSQTSDTTIKVTYHHNFFDGTVQRHPRVRYGKVHVFNNYFRNNSLYGVSSNCEADVVVEGNYFLNVAIPYESLRVGTSFPGDLVARNNILAGTTGSGSTRGTAFNPLTFYDYSVEVPSTIPDILTAYAGSGKYDFSSGNDGMLPIQLEFFCGKIINGNTIRLEWATICEINNYGFYVEKFAENLNSYLTISELISGAGTSNTPKAYFYIDNKVTGTKIKYRLKQVDNDGSVNYYGPIIVEFKNISDGNLLPMDFNLLQNFPNPFNPSTVIRYQLSAVSNVNLRIYDLLGREVVTLVNKQQLAGYHSVEWDASNLPSGVYFGVLECNGQRFVRKLMLTK